MNSASSYFSEGSEKLLSIRPDLAQPVQRSLPTLNFLRETLLEETLHLGRVTPAQPSHCHLMLKGKLTLRVMHLDWSIDRLFSFTLRSFSSLCLVMWRCRGGGAEVEVQRWRCKGGGAPVAEEVEPSGLGLGELVLQQDDRLVEGGHLVQLVQGAGDG